MNKNGGRNRHWPGSILDCAQLLFQLPQNQYPIAASRASSPVAIPLFERAVAPDPDFLPWGTDVSNQSAA
jgi:hypothetical protein